MSDELPYIFAAATPEQQAIARQSALYKKGDMSLVWMNDSALAELFLPKAEVDARIEWARQSALAECIAACEAIVRLYSVELPERWKDKLGGVPYEWQQAWANNVEIAVDIMDDIRALKGEGDE